MEGFPSPAQATYWFIQGWLLFLIIHMVGIACFAYIVWRRMAPLLRGERDPRFDQPLVRLQRVLKYWLGQWKHPRYKGAGLLHILIFAGFLILATRAFSLILSGTSDGFVMPGFSGDFGHVYAVVADYAGTIVFLCMAIAIVRRSVFKPVRYAVPAKFGKGHPADALF